MYVYIWNNCKGVLTQIYTILLMWRVFSWFANFSHYSVRTRAYTSIHRHAEKVISLSRGWDRVRPISPYVALRKCAFEKRISSVIVFTGGRAERAAYSRNYSYTLQYTYPTAVACSSGSVTLEICKRKCSRMTFPLPRTF